MKIFIIRCLVLLPCVVFIHGGTVRAQFLKQLLNAVKETTQDHGNSKANQPISTTPDTSAANTVLGAFARAAAANPNDTSAADLTMKALGMLTGQTAVSAKDSADAIKSYQTSTGGSGIYYEYSMTTSGKKITTYKDSSRIYFSNDGEGRHEIGIPMPGVKMNKIISIGHVKDQKYTVLLYPDSKTFSLNITDTSMLKSRASYQATKIGTETVLGYPCIHARIVSSIGSGLFKSTSTIDIWTSTAVPGYTLYKKMIALRASEIGMLSALENAGCGGFFVKLLVTGNDVSTEEVLIKAEERKFSADLFRIPAGYTESQENMIYHLAASPNK